MLGAALWAHQGSSRTRDEPVADPALIRRLDTGQAAYIYRGGVTYIQIKRLTATPPALPAQPAAAWQPPGAQEPAGHPGPADETGHRPPPPPPDAGALLDEAFGKETG